MVLGTVKEYKWDGHTYRVTFEDGECAVRVEMVDPPGGSAKIRVANLGGRGRGEIYDAGGYLAQTFSEALDGVCGRLYRMAMARSEDEICRELHEGFDALP